MNKTYTDFTKCSFTLTPNFISNVWGKEESTTRIQRLSRNSDVGVQGTDVFGRRKGIGSDDGPSF